MTRRQELANECVEACLADEVCLSDEECSRVHSHVMKALASVEREVWERVIAVYQRHIQSSIPKPGMDRPILSFMSWLQEQQAEVGNDDTERNP